VVFTLKARVCALMFFTSIAASELLKLKLSVAGCEQNNFPSHRGIGSSDIIYHGAATC
jgi:hypothetical protein